MAATPLQRISRLGATALVACGLWSALPAYALFEDSDARKAILELRQRVDVLAQQGQRSNEDGGQVRRSMLELQAQIEQLRTEMASLRGQNEQYQREISELKRRQTELAKGMDERLSRFEPASVQVDGMEFSADPAEKQAYDAALAVFRTGNFRDSAQAFAAFLRAYPSSGYIPSVKYWLGSAQYANRDYKEAVGNLRSLLNSMPNHARAPEAALTIANSQIELKDTKAARKTLEELLAAYPASEAASAAKDRLSTLR